MVDVTSVSGNTPLPVQPGSENSARKLEKPRSDGGTVFLHWLTAVSMVASLITGIRISADGLGTTWAQALSVFLPQGEMWTWHLLASLILFFATVAYLVYVKRAALLERNSAARLRTLTPPTTHRLRWRAINVSLHWFAYAAILILTVSGTLLYFGYGGLVITVHRALAWAMLFYIVIHTVAHFLYGGLDQLLRLFRPQEVVATKANQKWPMSLALSVGLVIAVSVYLIDDTTKPSLDVAYVKTPPQLDGILDDKVWANAKTVSIETHQGANLNGSGSSTVTVRAVQSDEHIHFAFSWQDPTRSLMRSPLIKKADGWYVMSTNGGIADVNDYYEDKFSVLFSQNDMLGGGGSTFLGNKPLKNYPSSPHKRGLHYTDDGRILDLWQWKSSRGGMLGHVDDMHFGPPKKPTAKQAAGKGRYAAGYASDPGKAIYEYNYKTNGPNGYASPVELKRLPIDLKTTQLAMGTVPDGADGSNDKGSRWWLTREDSEVYSAQKDAQIPTGTIIPSTLNIHTYAGDRADVSGGASWKDGVWTLEISRKKITGSAFDMSFHPGKQIFMWASVFDHNQIRHTRHQRPIVLTIK